MRVIAAAQIVSFALGIEAARRADDICLTKTARRTQSSAAAVSCTPGSLDEARRRQGRKP